MSPAASSRWCPTPEQLMILEEMYKGGVRTPSASQIQHITANLSYYGKIEGKNVFYWFQNHKARDRQKLRRKLCKQQQQLFQLQQHHNQQINCHNHLLHYLEPPVYSYAFHQLSHFTSSGFHPQFLGFPETLTNYKKQVTSFSTRSSSDFSQLHHHSKSERSLYFLRFQGFDWSLFHTG
ncbi:hypothetical protein F0562_021857 [Nyssa sinensis]|uniref:Homeobox domain-containing protein n=1 Tax=Nyssa sinensis TaxID=561372 RepID=A0A5J5BMT0_9ASTE|nr:hypothetical protein F0562_021857 [Nyssa sinensis]